MELKILSPKEEGFPQEIRWNNEELKAEIAEKMQEYKTLAFTEETIKEAKADRAKLNKLRTAFEDERKRIKKMCMAPYDSFEVQVKELLSLIDEPIRLIDGQIKEVEQRKRDDKRREVERIFKEAGFQPFVTLEQVWDEKWLNATVPISRIEEQMKSRIYQIGNDVLTIRELPEFSFEAMEVYKKTLDLTQAIKEGQRLSDIQKRKAAYEAEQRRKQEEEAAKIAAAQQACPVEQTTSAQASPEAKQETVDVSMTQQYVLDFRVWGTKEQIMGLRKYLVDNNIRFGKVG
nr:MAG TPA: Protein of unknown function (DUF1351) [Bacteriophage sp.]